MSGSTRSRKAARTISSPCIRCHNGCFNFAKYKGTSNLQKLDDSLHLPLRAEPDHHAAQQVQDSSGQEPKKVAIIGGGVGGMERRACPQAARPHPHHLREDQRAGRPVPDSLRHDLQGERQGAYPLVQEGDRARGASTFASTPKSTTSAPCAAMTTSSSPPAPFPEPCPASRASRRPHLHPGPQGEGRCGR